MGRKTKQTVYPTCNGGYIMTTTSVRKYGFFSFLFDLIMVILTGGLWLIWIFVREMRNR